MHYTLFCFVFIGLFSHKLEALGNLMKGMTTDATSLIEADKQRSLNYQLYSAAANGDLSEIVDLVTNQGASVHFLAEGGMTPLLNAAKHNRSDCALMLIAMRSDVRAFNNEGLTALHYAALFPHAHCLKSLLEKKADVNACSSNGETPLFFAARNSDCENLKLLISNGATLIHQAKNGHTALFEAVNWGHLEHIVYFLGLETEKQFSMLAMYDMLGRTPIFYAAQRSNTDCLMMLVAAKAHVNNYDFSGETPLLVAAKKGCWECLKVLLEAKADPTSSDNEGQTALHFAAEKSDISDYVKALILAGADINSQNVKGSTPLHCAAKRNDSSVCLKALLMAGAQVNIRDKNGETVIFVAVAHGAWDSVKALIEHKVDLTVCVENGMTVLHRAALKGSSGFLKILITAGAPVNAQDDEGNTTLHVAAKNDNFDDVRVLLPYNDSACLDENGLDGLSVAFVHCPDIATLKFLAQKSWLLLPIKEQILESRKRIFETLRQFALLKNQRASQQHILSGDKRVVVRNIDVHLLSTILSKNELLKQDVINIFLSELNLGRKIESKILWDSRGAVVKYLNNIIRKLITSDMQVMRCSEESEKTFTYTDLEKLIWVGIQAREREVRSTVLHL